MGQAGSPLGALVARAHTEAALWRFAFVDESERLPMADYFGDAGVKRELHGAFEGSLGAAAHRKHELAYLDQNDLAYVFYMTGDDARAAKCLAGMGPMVTQVPVVLPRRGPDRRRRRRAGRVGGA